MRPIESLIDVTDSEDSITYLLGNLSSLRASLDGGLASGGLLQCAKRKY